VTEQGRSVVNSPWRTPDYHDLLFAPDITKFTVR